MVDISKVDDKNITFNRKTCAAVYKADAGRDELGEFVLISETTGKFKTKIRIGELSVNGVAYGNNDSADAAASSLNQFIGSFKKGGKDGNVKTVNYKAADAGGNIQLTATDIGAASFSYVESFTYKNFRIGTYSATHGYLIKLRENTVADGGTVVQIVGYCSSGMPINTLFQFEATRVTGKPPAISNAAGYNYGYELKDLRIFAMLTGSNVYSVYLWILPISRSTHMGIYVFDSSGGSVRNIISEASIRASLPPDAERFNEVVFTPSSFSTGTT